MTCLLMISSPAKAQPLLYTDSYQVKCSRPSTMLLCQINSLCSAIPLVKSLPRCHFFKYLHLDQSLSLYPAPPFPVDLKSLQKSGGKFGISGGPRGDNLFVWDVELSDFDSRTLLYKDLQSYARTYRRKVSLH